MKKERLTGKNICEKTFATRKRMKKLEENSDDSSENKHLVDNLETLNNQFLLHERSKTHWYFAIAEFDNDKTSDFVYSSCNGVLFGHHSNVLDLRYVPKNFNFS